VSNDGTIYVGSNSNKFYAIHSNGTTKWVFSTGDKLWSSPAIDVDGTVYVGSEDGKLYAINPDGTQRWSYTTGDWITSSPAIGSDGTIYVGSWDFNLYALNPNGSLRWSFPTDGDIHFASPALGADGTIYIGTRTWRGTRAYDGKVYAIAPDGMLKWSFHTGIIHSTPAIAADGTIYLGDCDHRFYALNPDGTLKWHYTTGDSIYSSAAIGKDGTIYVGSGDSYFYALRPDGTLRWRYRAGDRIWSSPAIGSDYTVYVGSDDQKLYAIGEPGRINVPDDCSTIQAAINAASDGYAIIVSPGTYYENVVVNRSISLYPAEANTTISGGNETSTIELRANNVSISGFNIVSFHNLGLVLNDTTNSEVINNQINAGSGTGILIIGGGYNTLLNNSIASCTSYGIVVERSHGNVIRRNSMNPHQYSILLSNSNYNYIVQNEFRVHWSVITISLWGSHNNTIERNHLVDDGYQFSPYMELADSRDNRIFHNNFHGLNCGVYLDVNSTDNVWDNGYEGNYWCDFNGTDLDGDGVGDTGLPWKSIDYYPLINPHWHPADVNRDRVIDIFDAVHFGIAYQSTPTDSAWDPRCDIAEPHGFIDIFDVVLMAINYYREYQGEAYEP